MWPLTERRPKPLLPIAGRPLIDYLLDGLVAAGVRDIVVLLGWQGGVLRRHVLQRREQLPGDVQLRFLEQGEPLGTGHAVARGAAAMRSTFLCVNADVLLDPPAITAFLDQARGAGAAHAHLASTEVPDVGAFGTIVARDGQLAELHEKTREHRPGTINAGLYLFSPEFARSMEGLQPSSRGELELTDSLRQLVAAAQPVPVHPLQGRWREASHPWDLLTLNEEWSADVQPALEGTVESNVTIHGSVRLAPSATIRSGSYLEGPIVIGPRAVVGPNAFVRGATFLDADTKVGAACEVKNSIVLAGSHIPHQNYVGDSVIGSGCNLGAGTKVANLRLDSAEILAHAPGGRIATGRRKLGVIMGDDVKTGINSTIDVGTVLGSGTLVGPGAAVAGLWAAHSRVY